MSVILAYQSTQVVLRSPEMNDAVIIPLRATIKRAMNGDPWTYRQTPIKKKWVMNFANMNRNKIIEMDNLIKQSMGHEILLIDHFDMTYHVKITTTPWTAVHSSRRNNTFTLEFEEI
jgi:hypothetical protein